MTKADCKQMQEKIPLYIDNLLSDEEHDTVRAHIETCEACKAEYELMASVMKTAASLPEIDVPEGFHERLMEKVKAEAKQTKKTYARSWKSFYGVAAAAAVVAVSVVSFLQLDRDNAQTNPDVYLAKQTPVSTPAPTAETPEILQEEAPAPAESEATSAQPAPTKAPENKGEQEKTSAPKQSGTPAPQTEKRKEKTEKTEKQTEKTQGAAVVSETEGEAHSPEKAEPAAVSMEETPVAVAQESADNSTKAYSGGGGGGSARAAVQYTIVTVTVADSAFAEAKDILSAYSKDANGYKVGESLDAVLSKLSALEGYHVSTQTTPEVSANYIVLS